MSHAVLLERTSADFVVRLSRYPGHLVMPAHAHDEDGVSVLLGGAVVEEANHTSVVASAGWAVVKPAGTVHANRFGPMGATLVSLVPRAGSEHPLPARWSWLDRPRVLRSALRLLRAGPGEGAGHDRARDAALDADMLTELVASLADERHGQADVVWLRRVKRALDDPIETPPSVATLAADAAVHPVYLARRFRAAFGISVREYRQIVQVRRAIQLVVGSRRSLSDIAHSCGFADHSHMCRAFQSVARVTPSSLRLA